MENQPAQNNLTFDENFLELLDPGENGHELKSFTTQDLLSAFNKINEVKDFFQDARLFNLNSLLTRLPEPAGKKSFLVFKHNKYITIPTENIALFCVKCDSTTFTCFDGRQYIVCYSLEQIQKMLTEKQFFRINRQTLVNFGAIVEVEHYFARKLFIKLAVLIPEKLLVSKEKACTFLQWLENR